MMRTILSLASVAALIVLTPAAVSKFVPASVQEHPAGVLLPTVARAMVLLLCCTAAASFTPHAPRKESRARIGVRVRREGSLSSRPHPVNDPWRQAINCR